MIPMLIGGHQYQNHLNKSIPNHKNFWKYFFYEFFIFLTPVLGRDYTVAPQADEDSDNHALLPGGQQHVTQPALYGGE